MNKICIITGRYPTEVDPTALTFVQQLAWAMADQGKDISVICPLPVNINKKFNNIPDVSCEYTYLKNKVCLYFPKYFSFGQQNIGFMNTAGMTTTLFYKAVSRVVSKMEELPDAFYGHFITPSGLVACKLGRKYNIPSYIAYGESSTWSIDHIGRKKVKKEISDVSGIVSVSTKNKNELVDVGVAQPEKIKVFSNGYISSRFSPKNKLESRKFFGLPEDAFIVSFVGHFIERKGICVLQNAVNTLDDTFLICAGKGSLKPTGAKVLYANPVEPDELSMFYSASDVFVLPTLNEGCCNAIIEAMACGLPIISSDLSFNDDILDESNSLRIDPKDVDAVADAIKSLRDNTELRNRLAAGSLEKAKGLTLEKRAENIIKFMDEMVSRSK